ncbi:hypothetical protein J4N45_10305 [Vibrio sp. SCSIO 43140]|uniref:hypothetical protein n=1 Tax=Vibrio sp. SCSIO 43140 TaxID=2819100 RepID=UPI0020765CC8|nr:hypothetical protein [Vibrio sp. SCSIO 43140]USD58921.1 hypothetical protein J4N45_10305 [Vibrio sp. SCSIO 43140]
MDSLNDFESNSVTQNNYRAERMAFYGANKATIKALLGTIPKAAESPLETYRHISKKSRNGCRATFLHQTPSKFMVCNHLWVYFAQLTGEPLVSRPLASYVDEMLATYSAVMDDYRHDPSFGHHDIESIDNTEQSLARKMGDIRYEINFTQFYTLLNRISDNNVVPYTCDCGAKFIVLADRRGDRCPTCKIRHEAKRRLAQTAKAGECHRVSRLPPADLDTGVVHYE